MTRTVRRTRAPTMASTRAMTRALSKALSKAIAGASAGTSAGVPLVGTLGGCPRSRAVASVAVEGSPGHERGVRSR